MQSKNKIMDDITKKMLKDCWYAIKQIIFYSAVIGGIKTIYFFCNEKGMEGKLTKRKAKRIRRLTKAKINFGRYCPHIVKFFDKEEYFKNLEVRYGM